MPPPSHEALALEVLKCFLVIYVALCILKLLANVHHPRHLPLCKSLVELKGIIDLGDLKNREGTGRREFIATLRLGNGGARKGGGGEGKPHRSFCCLECQGPACR